MKLKLFVAFAAVWLTTNSHAQIGFYIKPYAGAGISNTTTTDPVINGNTFPQQHKSISSYDIGVDAGYRYNPLDLSVGLQYLNTGYKRSIVFGGASGFTDSGNYVYRYRQILVPVKIGYSIPINKKLSIMPQIGITPGVNLSVTSHLKTTIRDSKQTYNGYVFTSSYNRFILYGTGVLNFEYAASNKTIITISPFYNYMFTNMIKEVIGSTTTPKERCYSAGINLGVSFFIGGAKKAGNPSNKLGAHER